jgi:hypothetical protein
MRVWTEFIYQDKVEKRAIVNKVKNIREILMTRHFLLTFKAEKRRTVQISVHFLNFLSLNPKKVKEREEKGGK